MEKPEASALTSAVLARRRKGAEKTAGVVLALMPGKTHSPGWRSEEFLQLVQLIIWEKTGMVALTEGMQGSRERKGTEEYRTLFVRPVALDLELEQHRNHLAYLGIDWEPLVREHEELKRQAEKEGEFVLEQNRPLPDPMLQYDDLNIDYLVDRALRLLKDWEEHDGPTDFEVQPYRYGNGLSLMVPRELLGVKYIEPTTITIDDDGLCDATDCQVIGMLAGWLRDLWSQGKPVALTQEQNVKHPWIREKFGSMPVLIDTKPPQHIKAFSCRSNSSNDWKYGVEVDAHGSDPWSRLSLTDAVMTPDLVAQVPGLDDPRLIAFREMLSDSRLSAVFEMRHWKKIADHFNNAAISLHKGIEAYGPKRRNGGHRPRHRLPVIYDWRVWQASHWIQAGPLNVEAAEPKVHAYSNARNWPEHSVPWPVGIVPSWPWPVVQIGKTGRLTSGETTPVFFNHFENGRFCNEAPAWEVWGPMAFHEPLEIWDVMESYQACKQGELIGNRVRSQSRIVYSSNWLKDLGVKLAAVTYAWVDNPEAIEHFDDFLDMAQKKNVTVAEIVAAMFHPAQFGAWDNEADDQTGHAAQNCPLGFWPILDAPMHYANGMNPLVVWPGQKQRPGALRSHEWQDYKDDGVPWEHRRITALGLNSDPDDYTGLEGFLEGSANTISTLFSDSKKEENKDNLLEELGIGKEDN